MSTLWKVLVAILAIVGVFMVVGIVVHVLHWLIIGAIVLGVLYVAAKLIGGTRAIGGSTRKTLP